MAKLLYRLSTRFVETARPGFHADGNGLYLNVSPRGAKRWTFIFQWRKKRSEMSLGSAEDLSLGDARERAADARRMVRSGTNPIAARKHRSGSDTDKPAPVTFGAFAEELLNTIEGEFRNEKHKAQWRATLSLVRDPKTGGFTTGGHCLSLRDLPLDAIGTDEVLAVLQPIWSTKAETAARVRGRIERVLDAAKARGLRSGENPARWRGHLSALLPKRQRLLRGHYAALPYADVPAFVARLRTERRDAMAALALEWTILSAARSGEALGATLGEIDREAKVWTIPATRMKAGREHRVPLMPRMLEILAVTDKVRGDSDYLFPGPRPKKPLSKAAMTMLLRRMKVKDVTVHGFRSAFRDWVGEETLYRPDLAEAALAHVVGDATVRAYRRGDALEARRTLMAAWADFVAGKAPTADAA